MRIRFYLVPIYLNKLFFQLQTQRRFFLTFYIQYNFFLFNIFILFDTTYIFIDPKFSFKLLIKNTRFFAY